MTEDIDKKRAIDYHRLPRPGKLKITPTKPLETQDDLALAYSPGVAAACQAIINEPSKVADLTIKQNLVGVITNGSAVLGLGNIGALASKPVMEGKAVLFKKFANIDVFDLEINETDPHKLVEIIASLEPTFGAINLEDIRSPDCFIVEEKLRERMNIPVFHDDQHGTAIVVGAALVNGLRVVGKKIENIKLISTGGGAAGIACLNLFVDLGVKKENIILVDHIGVVFKGRKKSMTKEKAKYAHNTKGRTLADVIKNADVFLGLSAGGVLKPAMVKTMKSKPLIMALANPEPEIFPKDAKKANPEAVIATGRSDFPNQVNNVLCFPFIFRGVLDVGATCINEEMKMAAVNAIADLAMDDSSETVAMAYGGENLTFGPDYLIPKPFDIRLIMKIAPAVALAAMESGVATRPIKNFEAYSEQLSRFIFRSGTLMKPVFQKARQEPKRIVMAEGESHRVIRATQMIVDDAIAQPILIGRPEIIIQRIKKLGLRLEINKNFKIVNPESDPRYNNYWQGYHQLMCRQGISPETARTIIRTNTTVIAAMMLHFGEADTMICGASGLYLDHLNHVLDIIGKAQGVLDVSALSTLILPKGTFFLCDTHVTQDPNVEELVQMTLLSADAVRRFGEKPKVAMLSHSNFGSSMSISAKKMQEATEILKKRSPNLEVEGEMQADLALDENLRKRYFPGSRLTGQANLLILPDLNSANTAFNLLKSLTGGLSVGPMLIGAAKPVHILTPSVTAQGIFNISAIAVVDAQSRKLTNN
jgi:malate dehydrogenase (oxaloacetate-decarboxylating)(NADP+)